MNEEYLWDRTGEPDPEIARLEALLAHLQYRPETARRDFIAPGRTPVRKAWWLATALAAALAITFALSFYEHAHRLQDSSMWKISWTGGMPQVVRKGEAIETDGSTARLESDFVGEVQVDPHSRLRVTESTKDQQRLDLEHGTIHALIWAPPKQFVVDTPSSTTIDLGCRYTLQIAADGSGSLNVETGWVAFQWRNIESFIPAGAACSTKPGRGPGTPYFEDAPADLRTAVDRFDGGDAKALDVIISDARPRDALTLWHLLSRTRRDDRGKVFERFSELVKLPPGVTKQKVIDSDPAALDTAWNALNLGDTGWWREWKRKW